MQLSYPVARGHVPARRAQIRRRRTGRARPWCRAAGDRVGFGPGAGVRCAARHPARLCGRRHQGQTICAPRVRWAPSGTSRIGAPVAHWMLGKPIQLPEARDLYQSGLKIVSCYQYGKQDTADWLGGQNAGVAHAKRGWQLHVAAGGSFGAPIYTSIDDDPTFEQYKQQVAPYLRGLGSRAWSPTGRCLRQLQDHRVGTAGRAGRLLLAAQLGLARKGRPPGRAPASG